MLRVRKRLFAIHGWLGLNVGLWLFVVCLSGPLAVFAGEIEWLTEPGLRIEPARVVRWQETYDELRRVYPAYQLHTIARGEEVVLDSQAWIAYMTAPDGRYGIARIDPYQARVVRPFTTIYLRLFLDQLHYYLYSPPALIGVYIVTSLAVPLLLSLVTGLSFQRRWWRHPFQVRIGSVRRLSWSSVHRVVGLWAFAFGAIISVTGIWYFVEEAFVPVEIAYPDHPPVPEHRLAAHGPTPPLLSLQNYVDAAARAFPELEPTQIDLPGAPGGSVAVKGLAAGRQLVRKRANAVFLDPFDASLVSVRRSNEATWLSWWVDVADPLHFGYWGGLASKVLWCVLGLCLPVLVLSGAYLSFRHAELVGNPLHGNAPWSGWRVAVQWGVAAAVVAGGIWSCVTAYHGVTRPGAGAMVDIGARPVGPWIATLAREATPSPNGTTTYYLRLDAGVGRQPNVKRAALWIGDRAAAGERAEFSGTADGMRVALSPPGDLATPTQVTLAVQDWAGAEHIVEISDSLAGARDALLLPAHADAAQSADAEGPPAPIVFFGVVGGFVAITGAVVAAWLWTVARPGLVR